MALQITVGLNKKASRDYQSAGASLEICAELDSGLLTKPEELQRQISDLYKQAQIALDRQIGPSSPPASQPAPAPRPTNGGNGQGQRPPEHRNGNGHQNGHDGRPMSDKQRGAIMARASHADVDPYASARQTFGIDLDELSSKQASKLIDSLAV